MSLVDIHSRLANTAVFFTIALALWALWRFFRKQGVDSSFWGALVIGEVLYLVQAGLGFYLYLSGAGRLSGAFMHILYGVVALLLPPALFVFTRGGNERRAMLVYAVGLLFNVGILMRSFATSG